MDLIERRAAIMALVFSDDTGGMTCGQMAKVLNVIKAVPSAQTERKKGKWTEQHHAYSDEEQPIEEWQSCRCSVCGRYDTRPYMYYFSNPNYCSWCGAEMKGEDDDKR